MFADDEFGSELASQFAVIGLKVYFVKLGSAAPAVHRSI